MVIYSTNLLVCYPAMHRAIFHFVVPAPAVNITVLNKHNPTIGSPLLMECSVTTVRGINGSVDIVWMKDDTEIFRADDVVGKLNETRGLMLYTNSYSISTLQMTDNNTTYYCQAKINASSFASCSQSKYILNVTCEYVQCYMSIEQYCMCYM